MKTLCHVITGLWTGGAERALTRLLTHGLEGAYSNHVISLSGRGPQAGAIEGTGATLHCLNPALGKAGLLPALRKQVREVHPDLVQGWMYHSNLAALACRRWAGGRVPVCWNVRQSLGDLDHEKLSTRVAIKLGAVLSGSPDAIIYNSQLSRRQHEAYGYSPDRGQFVPNGFDVSLAATPATRKRIRQQLGVADETVLFAHFGRFHPVKEHALFVAAASTCAAASPASRFLLCGFRVEEAWNDLATAVPDGLRDRFIVFDDRNDVPDLLQAADVCVMSSRAEAFPNIVGEAMMAGTATIATDVGDVRDVLGDAGVVVPPRNVDTLAQAMITLAGDRPRMAALGAAGRARAMDRYTIDAVAAQYIALYERLLHDRKSG